MSRGVTFGAMLIAASVFCWFFPLFHIQRLGEGAADIEKTTATAGESGSVDPESYLRELWNGPLRTGEAAAGITQLWDAFAADASAARQEYGRQAGLGGAWYFCVRGQGTVDSIGEDHVVLHFAEHSQRVRLELGVVVDNTVREALGVNASDFLNSQDFNAISSELNRRVEEEVVRPNREALTPGSKIDVVGCAKIGRDSDLDPMSLIPIRIESLDSGSAE